MPTNLQMPTNLRLEYLLGKRVCLWQGDGMLKATSATVFLATSLDPLPGDRMVLDLGCGHGPATLIAANLHAGLCFHGIDMQPGLIHLAHVNAGHAFSAGPDSMPSAYDQSDMTDHLAPPPGAIDPRNERLDFRCGDIGLLGRTMHQPWPWGVDRYDIIMANPPFFDPSHPAPSALRAHARHQISVDSEATAQEPRSLDQAYGSHDIGEHDIGERGIGGGGIGGGGIGGGAAGLDIWFDCAKRRLAPKGRILMVLDTRLIPQAVISCARHRLQSIQLCPLWSRPGRRSKLTLLRIQANGDRFRLDPGIALHENESHRYAPHVEAWLMGRMRLTWPRGSSPHATCQLIET